MKPKTIFGIELQFLSSPWVVLFVEQRVVCAACTDGRRCYGSGSVELTASMVTGIGLVLGGVATCYCDCGTHFGTHILIPRSRESIIDRATQ
ncbi:hypothetical protein BJV77DRAFT_643631 [Russula vinacea]|nr:hypothetical protein BJV77DRAFT_643631 [Russula vinacea]